MRLGRTLLLLVAVVLVLNWGCSALPAAQETSAPTSIIPASSTPHPTPACPTATPLPPTSTSLPTELPPTPTPDVIIEEVTFTTTDGILIAATLFGDGQPAILMLHMGKGAATGNDQQDWHPLARRLAEQGFSALTIDFRGRGGSGGEFENDPVALDARAALDFLQQRGLSSYVCLGAGVGGTTCMVLALDDPPQGMVIMSSSLSTGPNNQVTGAHLAKFSMPKLLIYGEKDAFGFPQAMQDIYRRSADPKFLFTCDTAAHGSDLLYGTCGEEIYQQIISLLEEIN